MAETEMMSAQSVPPPADTAPPSTPSSPLTPPPPSPVHNRKRSIEDVKDLTLTPDAKKPKPSSTPTAPHLTKEQQEEYRRLVREAKEREKEEKRKEREAKEEERRKEKEMKEAAKRAEQEEKRREREAKKAEAEEKKRQREEEKRKKEEEKKAKEEEKRKKEEERRKKEGHQLSIAGFFKKPAGGEAAKEKTETKKTEDGDVEMGGVADTEKKEEKREKSDYEKTFFPFFLKPNVSLAPTPFARDEACRATVSQAIDEAMAAAASADGMEVDGEAPLRGVTRDEIVELLHIPPHKLRRRRNPFPFSTKDILARINAPDDPGLPPLELDGVKKPKNGYTASFYLELLKMLPTKTLKFAEDVRPPYTGTYTRIPLSSGLRKGRKPFERALPGVDYDYDSEAEWVAEEDGEDLDSEDEEEEEDFGDEDDLEGFLDDGEEVTLNRGGMGAPVLVATNSGLCWEVNGRQEREDLAQMRMEPLMEHINAPIDPFSTVYWQPVSPARSRVSTNMPPPSLAAAASNKTATAGTSPLQAADPNKKLVSPEDLPAFKAAIDGSDMTKAGLIEALKKSFPKIPKDAIKNTIDIVAERVGEKRDDKRWVLK